MGCTFECEPQLGTFGGQNLNLHQEIEWTLHGRPQIERSNLL